MTGGSEIEDYSSFSWRFADGHNFPLHCSDICQPASTAVSARSLPLRGAPRLLSRARFQKGDLHYGHNSQPLRHAYSITSTASVLRRKHWDVGDSSLDSSAFLKDSEGNQNYTPCIVSFLSVKEQFERGDHVERLANATNGRLLEDLACT